MRKYWPLVNRFNDFPAALVYISKWLNRCALQIYPFKDEAQTALFKDRVHTAQQTLHLCYKNQSIHGVSDISRCLFSDKHKTHKYRVGSMSILTLPVHASNRL